MKAERVNETGAAGARRDDGGQCPQPILPEEANVEQNKQTGDRRDPLADLEARVDAAIDEVRPKMKRALEELDARVDAAMAEIRPRVEGAMEDVRPRVDKFLTDVQPRLDSVLRRVETRIAELRRDLENRAARPDNVEPVGTLPPTSDPADTSSDGPPGADAAAGSDEPGSST